MMMNNMTQALTAAGVKLPPQNQRIWQWLKDQGPHSARDLASELKIGEQTVQATITSMIRRKMLEKIERKDHKGIRLNNHYGVLGKTFELKPEPKSGAAGRAAANAKKVVMAPTDYVAPAQVAWSPEIFLNGCSLGQLRMVYTFLKGLFK